MKSPTAQDSTATHCTLLWNSLTIYTTIKSNILTPLQTVSLNVTPPTTLRFIPFGQVVHSACFRMHANAQEGAPSNYVYVQRHN